MAQQSQRMQLSVISLGLALGVTSAIAAFVLGMAAGLFDWGVPLVALLSSIYVGYFPSFVGSITGAVWGFVDGLIVGVLIAWFYNKFLAKRYAVASEPEEERKRPASEGDTD